jgi:murein DD-endopeptidase MepM/ murein hydrolase activator NlpD
LVLVAVAIVLVGASQLAPSRAASSTAGDVRRDTAAAAFVAAGQGATSVASVAPAALPIDDRLDRRGTLVASPDTLTGYRWPLEDARITQGFGPATGGSFIVGGRAFHDGIDIANFCGDPIVAAHDGKVLAAGRGEIPRWAGSGVSPPIAPASTPSIYGEPSRSSSSSMTATATGASTPTSTRSS